MFVIPGGAGMVPTTMAGPGAGHPAHLIGKNDILKHHYFVTVGIYHYCSFLCKEHFLIFVHQDLLLIYIVDALSTVSNVSNLPSNIFPIFPCPPGFTLVILS